MTSRDNMRAELTEEIAASAAYAQHHAKLARVAGTTDALTNAVLAVAFELRAARLTQLGIEELRNPTIGLKSVRA